MSSLTSLTRYSFLSKRADENELASSPLEHFPTDQDNYAVSINGDIDEIKEDDDDNDDDADNVEEQPVASSLAYPIIVVNQVPVSEAPIKSVSNSRRSSVSLEPGSRPVSPTTNRYSQRKPLENVQPELYQRYKYYMRLSQATPQASPLKIPDHVLPKDVFVLAIGTDEHGKQASWTTIFSIWNTMIGSSLLSMPYAINEAGFVMGMILMILMCAICLYTCLLILEHDQENGKNGKVVEFAYLANMYLGRYGSWAAAIASVGIFWGAALVYSILMSTFMYNIADTVAFWTNGLGIESSTVSLYFTEEYVAVALVIIIFPLTLVKDFSFFAKFTSIGTISVVYMMGFTIYWAITNGLKYTDAKLFGSSFYHFTGILTLSFFLHNAILSIVRNQKHPEHNKRDVSIAFILVLFSYMLVGFLYYFSAEVKAVISSNFLSDVQRVNPGNAGLFIAQFLLLFQMITVFPLLVYIIRFQFMDFFYSNPYPSFLHVFALNICVAYTSIVMAVYYRDISLVLRYTGALFGLVAVYALPIAIHLRDLQLKGQLTLMNAAFHAAIVLFGIANLFAQFF